MVSSRVKVITALTLSGRSSDTTFLVPQILPKPFVLALANTIELYSSIGQIDGEADFNVASG